MKVILIHLAQEEGEEAIVEINRTRYRCMDCLGYGRGPKLVIGHEAEVRFSWLEPFEDSESWEDMFSGNPDRQKRLEALGGWSYRAFGEVISIDPPLVDCGDMVLSAPISSHDPKIVGEFLAFTIGRLDVRRA